MSTDDERSKEIGELRREVERLREIQRTRADAVAGVTHGLKTPLTSLLGYATILRRRHETMASDQRAHVIESMQDQAERIMRLIEELLRSSRADEAVPLQRVPVDLAEIARRVAGELGSARGRSIDVDVPDGDLGLYGDPPALEHVVVNLVDNALKYSDGPVEVRVDGTDGAVVLTVRDHGRGIAPDDLPHVFDRFRQAANARGGSSVGLGLYIVRNLVHAHGGTVRADSDSGKGTTFTVSLPRRADR